MDVLKIIPGFCFIWKFKANYSLCLVEVLNYEKRVIVINSTNINEANNFLSSQMVEHKKDRYKSTRKTNLHRFASTVKRPHKLSQK